MQLKSVVLTHATGNQNSRNALMSLVECDALAEFWTTICWNTESIFTRLLPVNIQRQLQRRSFSEASRNYIHTVPYREAVRLAVWGSPLRKFCTNDGILSIHDIYKNFDAKVARHLCRVKANAVYAYEGGAIKTFRTAKNLGMTTIYELPSSYWYWNQKVLKEECERSPAYSDIPAILKDSRRHLQQKDEEIELADYVFVPSIHVRDTLYGVVPAEKIRVINYGAPTVLKISHKIETKQGPLRVLYVGGLHARKGIRYLLEAADQLRGQVDVTLVGARDAACKQVTDACRKWRWYESLSHEHVIELMQESDVLVNPSLSEGCSLVILEALSAGLPVIVTPNCGVTEFIRDGREGFIVPICDASAIADRLSELDRNRDLLNAISKNAQETAEVKSWKAYRKEWGDCLQEVICR